MSDYLESLPTDEFPMDANESRLFNDLVRADTGKFLDFFHEIRQAVLIGVLFFVMQLEPTDTAFHAMIPYAKTSKTSLLFCKTAAFIAIVFMVQNYSSLLGEAT
jgi:hypothetical protein